ncbi:MAG: DUF89 family protein [Desulfobacteraceae bacterium]|jgi:uncharacterized protein with ATP-grasp and redox domains|nr:MAG: DUF89 family protein [Desulfobacteraceae bacterium]
MAGEGSRTLAERALAQAMRVLDEPSIRALSSPEIANRILREIRTVTGVDDPYRGFKEREISHARKISGRIIPKVHHDLKGLVALSAVGNSLDFFSDPESSLDAAEHRLREGPGFFVDHRDRFEDLMEKAPDLVVYLTDNAGELCFDMPLLRYLQKKALRSVVIVKGGPSLNDLTRAELEPGDINQAGLEVADTGTDGAGIDWAWVSNDFLNILSKANLVISKGMANFETLFLRPLAAPVFFIFKVKCLPIRDYLSAPMGSFIALLREGGL